MLAVDVRDYTMSIKKRKIFKNNNLQLEAGGIYGLYGHNGSGKSMLMRAIAGLITPTSGQVFVFGKEVGKDVPFPPDMGLIIENVGFWPHYTGFENLQALASIRSKITDQEIRDVIVRVGLDPADTRPYRKYSLGMKQRLGVAQAVMERPSLLMLDEPTNALDEDGVNLVRQIIREENARGATVMIASHNKEDLTTLCGRFYKMNDGTLKEEVLQA